MASTPSMLQHLRNYATGGLVSALAVVITFPILTRTLDVSEYGALGLVTATLSFFVAFGKLGLQHSVVRFYEQVKNANNEWTLTQFYSTLMLLMAVLSCVAMALWLITGNVVLPMLTDASALSGYFLIATLFLFFRMLGSIMTNVLNAQQQSQPVMLSMMIRRFSYLIFVLLLLWASSISTALVLAGYVIAELISLSFLIKTYLPGKSHQLGQFSVSLAKTLMVFGLPLMILESLGLALRLTDRYLIQILIDDNALGQYAASYNLTAYVELILISSLISSVKPRYNQLWETEGRKKTQLFLSNGLHLYLMVGIPFAALFALTAPHLMNILASGQYAPGTVVIPWIICAILIDGSIVFLAAGLYIKKDTRALMLWGGVAMLLNLILNFIFIPLFGIVGASMVTLASFAVFAVGLLSSSFKVLNFDISLRNPMLVAAASFLVWLLLRYLSVGNDFADLILKGVVGCVLLMTFVLILDTSLRALFTARVSALLPKRQ